MTPLEQRYRSLLRRLPVSYRAQWEDDMVATYLVATVPDDPEDAEYVEQCGRPSREERASITRLAVRLRLGGAGDAPHAKAWGDAVRRVALIGLLVNCAGAFEGVWHTGWLSGFLPWTPLSGDVADIAAGTAPAGWEALLLQAFSLLWVVAFLAALAGRQRAAAMSGAIAFLPTLAGLGMNVSFGVATGFLAFLILEVSLAIVALLPLAALAAFHAQAPPVARRPWVLGLLAAAVVAALPAYVWLTPTAVVFDRPGLFATTIVAAGLAHLASRRARANVAWTLALAILAGVVLALRAVTLLELVLLDVIDGRFFITAATVQTLLVAAVGAVLWVRAARLLRALRPAVAEAPPPRRNAAA